MKRKWPFILFFLSLIFIVAGLMLGEYGAVLEKAVTVCLACIGIG